MTGIAVIAGESSAAEATMDGMAQTPAHAKPSPRDHLWVLAVIAACALIETFPSWVGIGAVSGFPVIGGSRGMPTDWTLAVTSEAYWFYALYAGIVAAAGRRSRLFALWSAAAVFALSLVGQAAYHLMAAAHRAGPPQWVVVFVAALPVIILAMTAVLVHLRHADRAEAEEAAREQEKAARAAAEAAAADDERAALRAELDAARAGLEPLQADLATARSELARMAAKTEALTRKLEAATARKRGTATARKQAPATARKPAPATGSATAPEDAADETANVDKEALVLRYLAEGHSASEAGKLAGLSDSRGRQIARKLAVAAPQGIDGEAASP